MKARKINEGYASEEGRRLDRIFSLLGYDGFHEFIGDNPGCYEVITNWIEENFDDQLMDEEMDPDYLEKLGMYRLADQVRDRIAEEETEKEYGDIDEAAKPSKKSLTVKLKNGKITTVNVKDPANHYAIYYYLRMMGYPEELANGFKIIQE